MNVYVLRGVSKKTNRACPCSFEIQAISSKADRQWRSPNILAIHEYYQITPKTHLFYIESLHL